METNYLPLNEYSNKYKVSVSTLRRKIKSNEIAFRFEQGKYLILDQVSRPSMNTAESRPSLKLEKDFLTSKDMRSFAKVPTNNENANLEEPILTAANKLLTELKSAYTRILQEKEEQILHLKEEASDLKTLVRVLESDNERLSSNKKSQY